jgi:phosphopantothenoylcysteine decarboxylase/phosphopantothenate--cysteine ligase
VELPPIKQRRSDFIKAGAHVQVIMTPASKDVTPLTLSTLSKMQFIPLSLIEMTKMKNGITIELGLWADIIIIAQLQQILCRRWQTVLAITFYLLTYLQSVLFILLPQWI